MATNRLSITFDRLSTERIDQLVNDDQGIANEIREALALENLYHDVTQKIPCCLSSIGSHFEALS